jgi:excinuclease ABC subunit C
MTEKPRTGHEVIADHLRTLDGSPGVYRMLNAASEVLYVGKARNLKARVSNYARPSGHSARIARMIPKPPSMMFLTTRTEVEALLLEQNLIKQLKPRYNVLMRDDKSFPNILIGKEHAFPQIKKHRGAKKEKGSYFGPFASVGRRREPHAEPVAKGVPVCAPVPTRCWKAAPGPACNSRSSAVRRHVSARSAEAAYAGLVADAERFLSGKSTTVQADLAKAMAEASEAMEFERAAALRDRIRALTAVQTSQGINPRGVPEADVIAVHLDHGQACVQVFFIRANQSWGNRDFYPRTGSGAEEPEILQAFLTQFYDDKDPPRLILLSHPVEDPDLVAEALSDRAGRKVELTVPQRGEKAELVENAARNARESLARRMAETGTQAKLLQGLAEAFDLEAPPQRIEIYDNAHIQGADAVGGMVVAGAEGFLKSQYRKFNIRGQAGANSDDFGMMREVLSRRFDRLLKEDPDRKGDTWPDLLLIDGGAGQVSAVCEILAEMGVDDIPVVGVAKGIDRDAGKEEFHRPGERPFALQRNDPVLYFIQRLRDEAHRWANGAHRAKRAKAVGATPLDEIPGIGAARKRALLAHFGSAKAVSRAALPDLMAVDGISQAMAETVYNFFHRD